MKYLKYVFRLLNRNCVIEGGLNLSKEVLWVPVGQRVAKLPAIKVGGLKKNSANQLSAGEAGSNRANWQNFFLPPTLTASSSVAL